MFGHIRMIQESDDKDYVNKRLQIGWVILGIVNLKDKFLYVIGLPYFNVEKRGESNEDLQGMV